MKLKELKESVGNGSFLTDKDEILNWLYNNDVNTDFCIVGSDGTVSVSNIPVMLENIQGMKHLPVKFDEVTSNFTLKNCSFETLLGCPDRVGDDFAITFLRKLINLEHSPQSVKEYTIRDLVGLKTLKGMTQHAQQVWIFRTPLYSLEGICAHIGQTLHLQPSNKFNTLEGIADHIEFIGDAITIAPSEITHGGIGLLLTGALRIGTIDTSEKLEGTAFEIIEKYMPDKDKIFECQNELIEKGFEEHALL